MDRLWAQGWRHFGVEFFRYSLTPMGDAWQVIIPLRLPLHHFSPTKSQRRVLRKNADVEFRVVPAVLSPDAEAMFQRHAGRFTENIPDSLRTFFSDTPATVPCECLEFQCWVDGTLAALSFLDVGETSVSSVYGMFEPEHSSRSLGIFTLLQEMQWARVHGFRYHYPGYTSLGSSAYDYKKQFRGLEGYSWKDDAWKVWEDMSREGSPSAP